MVFSEKLELLFGGLGITNMAIAKAAGLDPSLISRYRTGARIPQQGSKYLAAIANAFVTVAGERTLCKRLCDIGALPKRPEDSMLRGKAQRKPHKAKKAEQPALRCFKLKLNILMDAFNVSNVRLAKALSVDSSLISRFRTGARAPQPGGQILQNICCYFAAHAKSEEQLLFLLEAMELPQDTDASDPKRLKALLLTWMADKRADMAGSEMDRFLTRLDNMGSFPAVQPPLDSFAALQIGTNVSARSFWGIDGIRQAAIEFLGMLANGDFPPRTLFLYSDQSIEWLTGDPVFMQRWMSLMLRVIEKGNTIRIVHVIDRDLPEVFAAIEGWLPLYMTGKIESLCCRRQKDTLFRRTLFIAPDLACLSSHCVAGTESLAEYQLDTDPVRLRSMILQFGMLLSFCRPLVETFTKQEAELFQLRAAEFDSKPGNIKSLLSTLSVATMGIDQTRMIFARARLSQQQTARALQYCETRRRRFFQALQNNMISQYVAIPPPERLADGQVRVDIPAHIAGEPLYYTAQEYKAHLQSLAALLDRYPNYLLHILPAAQYRNLRIVVKENVAALLVKEDDFPVAFHIAQPQMTNAFWRYLSLMDCGEEGAKTARRVREDTIEKLRSF